MITGSCHEVVERRLRNWELMRAQKTPPPATPKHCVQPYVAISRLVGSGGGEIARELGGMLDWPVFDREILNVMAEDEHVQRRLYELTDERNVSFIESLVAPFRTEAPKARDDYFHKLVRAVRTIACQSSVIFLGRGAGFILPNEVGLHVRIVAPFEPCVARHAKQTGLAPDDAAKQVRSTNEARDGFLRQRFGLDPTDPCRYDLLVNTATFAPRDAARVIVAALHAK